MNGKRFLASAKDFVFVTKQNISLLLILLFSMSNSFNSGNYIFEMTDISSIKLLSNLSSELLNINSFNWGNLQYLKAIIYFIWLL